MNDKINKIIKIEMAETQSENITPEQKQERAVAIYDLIENNSFELNDHLGIRLKDDINSKARISMRMKDISTVRMDEIVNELQLKIDEIFPSPQYNVAITGSSMVFLEGTRFLVVNLMYSLILVIILISIFIMHYLSSDRNPIYKMKNQPTYGIILIRGVPM